MLGSVKLSDAFRNPLIPRVCFSSPSPPPEPEPVKPIEIPPPAPVVIPPPPPMPVFEPPPPPTPKEKYAMTPEIPMRFYESKSKESKAQLADIQSGTYQDPRLAAHPEAAGDPRVAQAQGRQTAELEKNIATYDQRAAQARKRTEIINPAALHVGEIIPPPASTSSTETQEKADEEKRKQANRQGMSSSIIAGEQSKDYASSATGTGSLLG